MKRYIVVGRVPGDDDDSVNTFIAKDDGEAIGMFVEWLHEVSDNDAEARAEIRKSWGDDTFISSIDEDEEFNKLAKRAAELLRSHKETHRSLEVRPKREFTEALGKLERVLKKLGVSELPERWVGGRKQC